LREASNEATSTQQSAECLEYLAYLAQDAGNAADALKYGNLALERLHRAPHPPLSLDAAFLGSVGYAQHLGGHNDAAETYYDRALQEFSLAGRDRSPEAVAVRNNWAIVSDATGNPRRSLALYEETLRIASENDPVARPPAYLLGNHAYALEALGRYAQARDGYQECEARAVQASATQAQAFCLLGLVKVSRALGDSAATDRYLRQASEVIKSSVPPGFPAHAALLTAQGRIALDKGALGEARSDFDDAIAATQNGLRAPNALLGRAELNLRAGQLEDAEGDARRALGVALQAQGGVRYSRIAGEAWLIIARILLAKNESAAARGAAHTAFIDLSNTVDDTHPSLQEARRLAGTD
jgi:tetratricopeptide (TPR) repeat protein